MIHQQGGVSAERSRTSVLELSRELNLRRPHLRKNNNESYFLNSESHSNFGVMLADLCRPGLEAATLITVYEFIIANKLFCHNFVTIPAAGKDQASPFSTFISFNSYLYQHAYRTARAAVYAYLTLLIFLVLVEDATTTKLLCDTIGPVRLCRQRPPYLPLPKGNRSYAAAIVDLLTDGINHNLRKRLDTSFYIQSLTVLHKLLSYLSKSRTKLSYHWSELWRSLLSFTRFLTSYPEDLKNLFRTSELVHALVDVLVLALTSGEAFLPDTAVYDDLFYKIVESGEALTKLRDTYGLSSSTRTSSSSSKAAAKSSPINTLISVSEHYNSLIESQRAKKEHLSPREVNKVIKQGYDTLNFEPTEGVEEEGRFREVEYKSELKRVVRVCVADAVALAAR